MDMQELDVLAETLRPFARAYISLPGEMQIALGATAPVRVSYLRDAYLILSRYERMRSNRPTAP